LLAHFHPPFFIHPPIFYLLRYYALLEQFGYGFGFAAFMMYLIYVADGESKPHYSIATGFMALGMMLPEWQVDYTRIFGLRKLLYLGF
jgi:PAT family beta-lactamase induction signal transducer AmpG